MMRNVGICGYGNLGKAVETILQTCPDLRLTAVFSRRKITTATGVPVYDLAKIPERETELDLILACGGSYEDLPVQTPFLARRFCVADPFDTHTRMKEHLENVRRAAEETGHLALVGAGWDPGIFSVIRLFSAAMGGDAYTFWGPGISQGHSDVLRRVAGVADGRQITVPVKSALKKARRGRSFSAAHRRKCYVVAAPGARKKEIAARIRSVPGYFAGTPTSIRFLTQKALLRRHGTFPHAGQVLFRGTAGGEGFRGRFCLQMDSNPAFTAALLVAYGRAVLRLHDAGKTGAITVFDVPPALLFPGDDVTAFL